VTSQYAAWVDSITPVGDTQDQWSVGWKRDFSFQFLNISDAGRPPSDGAYATALGFDGEVLVAGVTTKLSDSILGEPPTASAWSPSVEERGMLDGLFDIQNGPCVDGCLAE
jgi:hypothetical protein